MSRKLLREIILLRKFDAMEKFTLTPKIYDVIIPSNVVSHPEVLNSSTS